MFVKLCQCIWKFSTCTVYKSSITEPQNIPSKVFNRVECSTCTVYKSNNTGIPYSVKFSRDKFFADWPFRKFCGNYFADWGSGQLATPSLMWQPPPCAIKPFIDTCACSNSGEVWQPKLQHWCNGSWISHVPRQLGCDYWWTGTSM